MITSLLYALMFCFLASAVIVEYCINNGIPPNKHVLTMYTSMLLAIALMFYRVWF